jgi:hypothetical protein
MIDAPPADEFKLIGKGELWPSYHRMTMNRE